MCRHKPYAMLLIALILTLISAGSTFAKPGDVVLRFRYWGDFKEIAIIQKTIDAFEKDHPGVTVHGERVPPTDEYVQKLLTEQAAGLAPDVVFCGGNYTQFASRGMLADLERFLANDHTVKLSDYYPQLVKVFSNNGKLYALPRDIAPMGLVYYNKKLFDQAHIPYPDGTWSWDYVAHPARGNKDFHNDAKLLTKPASTPGQIVQFGYAANAPGTTMDNFVYSSGAQYVDDITHPTKMYYTSDPSIEKAAQLVEDMTYDPKLNVSPSPADLQSSGVGSHELFAQGKIAMYVTGIWEVPRFRTEITTFDWDIAAFPAGPTGLHGVKTGWSGYGITEACKHKTEDWQLLTYLPRPSGL